MFLRGTATSTLEAVTQQRAKAAKPQFSPEEKAILNKLNAEHKQKLAKSYTIRDFCESLIEKNYVKHEKGLLRAIAMYRDRNVEKLSSPYILDNMLFTQSDIDIVFKCCGTTKEEVQDMLNTLDDLPINTDQYFQDRLEGKKIQKRNIIPFRVLLIMIIRYYIINNDMQKADEVMFYYACSQFPSIYTAQFRNGVFRKPAMIYAVDHMSKKFTLKKEGSVGGAIVYPIKKAALETYKTGLLDGSDFWIPYIIDQFKSRTNEMMKSVREAYEEAYVNGDVTYTEGGSFNDEGEMVERETSGGIITTLADKYASRFYSQSINLKIATTVANSSKVSVTEIRHVLGNMQQERHIDELRQFYESVFTVYSDLTGHLSDDDLHSISFIQKAIEIYKKGNSNDKSIAVIKKITNLWLTRGSESYKASNNAGTLNSFRRAIYLYFIFIIRY